MNEFLEIVPMLRLSRTIRLLVFSTFMLLVNNVTAQCLPSLSACTLRVPTDPLCMVPDTNEMSPGYVNEPYDRHIHFIFESSITVTSNPQTGQQLPFPVTAMMEYMVFDSLGGLPPGISYEMHSGNPLDSTGKFSPADSSKAFGCIHLYGVPTQANTYATSAATIYMKPHGCVLGGLLCGDFPWPVTYRVPIELAQGISSLPTVKSINILPYPHRRKLQVDIQALTSCLSNFRIVDITGKIILNKSILISEGQNQNLLDFSFVAGFYILQVTTPHGLSAKSFIW